MHCKPQSSHDERVYCGWKDSEGKVCKKMKKKCEKHFNWETLKKVEAQQQKMILEIARGNTILHSFIVRRRLKTREKQKEIVCEMSQEVQVK